MIVSNLIGKRFGKLVVISKVPSRTSIDGRHWVQWFCKCDCGNDHTISSASLKTGSTKSCGCYRREFSVNPDAPLNYIMYSYKSSARRRGYTFNLTKEEFRKITSSNCFYCGASPALEKESRGGFKYFWNGIDRVENSVGYELNNVVPCCSICNLAKNDLSQDEFLSWVNRIVEFTISQRTVTL